ncbi:MAG: UDP-N-acetylglucosamine 4,6-dehydratase (inverting) [Methylococcaceae bacterium]
MMKLNLNKKSILITGGTGSFGKKCIKVILDKYPQIERIIVYSRDELKQFEMAQEFDPLKYKAMRYFIGDIRDKDRLKRACENVDCIIHAAALKQVPAAEYNPMECIKTNVYGAQNVIDAALDSGVKNVIALSTDKAAAPLNLYGATKLCSDKLFIAANNMSGTRDIKFTVVRYGNVMGSRGSVIPFFIRKKESGILPITDTNMTRFNISLEDSVSMVLYALENTWGGELFIPKIPSYKITDLAEAIGPNCEQTVIGIRQGEKIHEEMITSADSFNTVEVNDYYIILPQTFRYTLQEYLDANNAKPVEPGFSYNSGANTKWLNVEELRVLIKQHVDPDFKV